MHPLYEAALSLPHGRVPTSIERTASTLHPRFVIGAIVVAQLVELGGGLGSLLLVEAMLRLAPEKF
jgi:hypothetical protein